MIAAAARSTDVSRRRVVRAIAEGIPLLGPKVSLTLDALRGPRWDHPDEQYQALSADLIEVVRMASVARSRPSRLTGAL
jgi:hypothetical protein